MIGWKVCPMSESKLALMNWTFFYALAAVLAPGWVNWQINGWINKEYDW